MPKPYIYTGINIEIKEFPTYVEFKRNLKQLIENSHEKKITVYRSRRGEWGEWFEKWKMLGDKPIKIDEGWL